MMTRLVPHQIGPTARQTLTRTANLLRTQPRQDADNRPEYQAHSGVLNGDEPLVQDTECLYGVPVADQPVSAVPEAVKDQAEDSSEWETDDGDSQTQSQTI